MRKLIPAILLILSAASSFAQSHEGSGSRDGSQRRSNGRCSKLYIDLGTGINANTSLLGGGIDLHVSSDISINAGIGLMSSWGTKFYAGAKGYLKPCHKGWAFGAGVTHNMGISQFSTKLETYSGQQLVELKLYPQTNIYGSAYKYWRLGRNSNRIFLQLGWTQSVTTQKFKQLSGPPITTQAAAVTKFLAPGGLILGFGFCFGT